MDSYSRVEPEQRDSKRPKPSNLILLGGHFPDLPVSTLEDLILNRKSVPEPDGLSDPSQCVVTKSVGPFEANVAQKLMEVMQKDSCVNVLSLECILVHCDKPEQKWVIMPNGGKTAETIFNDNRTGKVLNHKGMELVSGFSTQMCKAIAFLHKHGFVHNDIKPANILSTGGNSPSWKLIDFGIAMIQESGEFRTISVCNKGYPYRLFLPGQFDFHKTAEWLEGVRGYIIYPKEQAMLCDWWALHISLFEILHKKWPYGPTGAAFNQDSSEMNRIVAKTNKHYSGTNVCGIRAATISYLAAIPQFD